MISSEQPLFILACDHRTSFTRKLFEIEGIPSHDDRAAMAEAKLIVLDGLATVASTGATSARQLGALFDEELGESAAHAARERGLRLAICAEKSSRVEFELEYGDAFAAHIERFAPDFVKILCRYRPGEDRDLNERQTRRLRELSDWLAERPIQFLFELIVPGRASDDRSELVASAMTEIQDAGVEPDIWKLEGLDTVAAYERVAGVARANGRDHVGCVVLGAGADTETVEHWLREAARSDGFMGFAIGRTIFWDALRAWRRGNVSRAEAVDQIAANYARMIDVFCDA